MDTFLILAILGVALVLGVGWSRSALALKRLRSRAELASAEVAERERASAREREEVAEARQSVAEKGRELDRKLEATREELRELVADEFGKVAETKAVESNQEVEKRAKRALLATIQRSASTWTREATVVNVKLPSDDVKGRLIGREGRNIKAFEQVTGTELLIDETPAVVSISCFDPRRRLAAQLTLNNLVLDGRVHPGRIEEIHAQVERDLDSNLPDIGAEAAERAGVSGLGPEVLRQLGALKFRGSQGQNVLEHSVEVAGLAAVLAAETGADPVVSRRAGLLHDIGKGLGPEWGEAHALAGMSFLQAHSESAPVCLAVGAHHYDVAPSTPEAQVVIVADSVSGSRPGARSPQEAVHLARMAKVEATASELQGVQRAVAYDSGRDLRVFVEPTQVDDLGAARIAKQVARMIKAKGEYPGPVKVTVIRETRAVEVSE